MKYLFLEAEICEFLKKELFFVEDIIIMETTSESFNIKVILSTPLLSRNALLLDKVLEEVQELLGKKVVYSISVREPKKLLYNFIYSLKGVKVA